MKKHGLKLFFTTFALLVLFGATARGESEPNDTYLQANVISLDGSVSGTIGVTVGSNTDSYDWYKFTTAVDGKITFIAMPATSALNTIPELFDQNGQSYISGTTYARNEGGTDTLVYRNLKAGTYYLRMAQNGSGSYTLSNVFTPTAIPNGNDAEPNDTYQTALTTTINSSPTGHIGYFGNGTTDSYDWYKIALPKDGKITFIAIPEVTLNTIPELFDQNGESYISGTTYPRGEGGTDTLAYNNLKAGTYYLRMSQNGFGSYTLRNIFTPTAIPDGNDAEPNDTYPTAVSLTLNGSYTGHIGYFGNGTTDIYDWYKLALPNDGKITFIAIPEVTLNTIPELFDQNGESYISGTTFPRGEGGTDTLAYNNLKAGTYYLRMSQNGFGSYTLRNIFTQTAIPNGNDTEPNDTYQTANALTFGATATGHIGYFGNNSTDIYDWYYITFSSAGKYTISGLPERTSRLFVDLYDKNGASFLSGCTQCGNYGEPNAVTYNITSSGTYYIRISNYGYGSYTLRSYAGDFTLIENPEDNNDLMTVYPNPFTDQLVLKSNSGIGRISVYDILGTLVMKADTNNSTNYIMSTSNMPKGIYLISIEEIDGKHTDMKVIKE